MGSEKTDVALLKESILQLVLLQIQQYCEQYWDTGLTSVIKACVGVEEVNRYLWEDIVILHNFSIIPSDSFFPFTQEK